MASRSNIRDILLAARKEAFRNFSLPLKDFECHFIDQQSVSSKTFQPIL